MARLLVSDWQPDYDAAYLLRRDALGSAEVRQPHSVLQALQEG